jgi:hypothetical protein
MQYTVRDRRLQKDMITTVVVLRLALAADKMMTTATSERSIQERALRRDGNGYPKPEYLTGFT